MKKILALTLTLSLLLTGCNYRFFDTTYHFDRAQIRLSDGTIIEGDVDNWTDYEGDQIQITIDGITYLIHAENMTLIAEN